MSEALDFELIDARVHAEHISTEHLRGEIAHRTTSGGVVSAIAQGGQLVLTLAYNVAVARLLSPAECGAVAVVLTAGGFLQVFTDAGLSTATIHRELIAHGQGSNLFWVTVAVSAAAMA